MSKVMDVLADMATLAPFIGRAQMACVVDGLRSEEREHFEHKLRELAERVRAMPAVYEQDGNADPTAFLHYFAGGADFWITEKDVEMAGEGQIQAFGLADMFGDGGEMGYINVAELISENVELDFHFDPRPISMIQEARGA